MKPSRRVRSRAGEHHLAGRERAACHPRAVDGERPADVVWVGDEVPLLRASKKAKTAHAERRAPIATISAARSAVYGGHRQVEERG